MEYIFLLSACVFFSLQFIFQKLFEKRTRGDIASSLWNQVVSCAVMFAFLLVKSRGAFDINPHALMYSAFYSLSGIVCSAASIIAMTCGKVSALGTCCLAGGMILPFVYGIFFLGEPSGALKWIGMAVLCASLVPALIEKNPTENSVKKEKSVSPKFVVCCLLVFFSNGLVSIFSKMHQISPFVADENSFLLASSVIRIAICLGAMLVLAFYSKSHGNSRVVRDTFVDIGKNGHTSGRMLALLAVFAGAYAVMNTLGNIFSLRCMITMDASLQFPLLSAAVIVITALLGRVFFGEKITRSTLVSLILSAAGIAIFML